MRATELLLTLALQCHTTFGVLKTVKHSGPSSHPQYSAHFSTTDTNVMFFANYGFEAGGSMTIDINAKLSDTFPEEVGDRALLWALRCNEKEYDEILRAEFRSNHGYCVNGMYTNFGMCESWNLTTVGFTDGYYHATRHLEETIDNRELAFFFLVSCELKGDAVPLRSCTVGSTGSLVDNWGNDGIDDVGGVVNSRSPTDETGAVPIKQQQECPRAWPPLTERELQVSLTYTFQNPNGLYLSFTQEPYIVVYAVLVAVWIPITLVWLWNTWRMRRTVDISLQRKMSYVPVFKTLSLAFIFVRWELKGEGIPYRESMPFVWPVLLLARIMYAAAFAETMLLIGKGWKLTREHLHPTERRNIYTISTLYCIGCLLYYIWGTTTSAAAFLTLLLLAFTYMVVLYMVWFSVSQNIAAVRFHLDAIRFRDINPLSTPVFETYTMLRKFRSTYFGYLVMGAFADIMTVSVARRSPWLPALCDELLEMATYVVIGYTFRARPFEPLLQQSPPSANAAAVVPDPSISATTAATSAPTIPVVSGSAGTENSAGELQEWSPGIPLPVNPRSDLLFPHNRNTEVVVITNPGSDTAAAIGVPPGQKVSMPAPTTATIAMHQTNPQVSASSTEASNRLR